MDAHAVLGRIATPGEGAVRAASGGDPQFVSLNEEEIP
jgi:hypothetical protein